MKRITIAKSQTIETNNIQITVVAPADLYFTWFGGEIVINNQSGTTCTLTGFRVINDTDSYVIQNQEVVTVAWDNGYYVTAQSTEIDRIASEGMDKDTYDPNTVDGDAFDMDNMVEGTNKILTAAERSAITTNTSKVSFPEAPEDGTQYARKDAGWIAVSGTGDMLKSVYDTTDSGIVDESTKLETARNINGVAFDGTADITIPSSGTPTVPVGFADAEVTYGIVPNSATNRDTEFGNMVNGSVDTFIKEGTYEITDGIVKTSGSDIVIRGAGIDKTIINVTAASDQFIIRMQSGNVDWEDVTFDFGEGYCRTILYYDENLGDIN